MDLDLPKFIRSTLHILLKKLGFAYARRGSEAIVTGREVIVCCRKYVVRIQWFRVENEDIVYTVETWANTGFTVEKEWQERTVKTLRKAFLSYSPLT
jgi:hypothetical protein